MTENNRKLAATTKTSKTKCLPTYLVLDTSGSMKEHEQTLNDTLEDVFDTLRLSPRVSEFAYISIITFNTRPHLVLEMTDIEDAPGIPQLACDGMTNYSLVFDLIRSRIDADVPALNAAGKAVLRPAVFLFTDGFPSDENEWQVHFNDLVTPSWRRRPHVITYGFGEARADVLGKMATKAAFLADSRTADKEALTKTLTSLLQTLVASAKAEELLIPTDLPGFIRVPVEYTD
ncbi:MAG: hypothetical protein JO281_09395 [Pseudonocardiales bacterium]|nr:hypothetical protein [Pseudonocardiales bacterium]